MLHSVRAEMQVKKKSRIFPDIRYANKPVCQTMTKEFCDTYPIKQCRYTRTPESRPIPVKDCRTKRENKCWEYEGHECDTKQATHNETFT